MSLRKQFVQRENGRRFHFRGISAALVTENLWAAFEQSLQNVAKQNLKWTKVHKQKIYSRHVGLPNHHQQNLDLT